MAAPLLDASALGGPKFKPARSQRQCLKAATLSESIGCRSPELDSSLRSAIGSLGIKMKPLSDYRNVRGVESIRSYHRHPMTEGSEETEAVSEQPAPPKKSKKQIKAERKKAKKVEATEQPKPKPVAKSKPATAQRPLSLADAVELSHHISGGDVRGAKAYLEYHFGEDVKAQQEFIVANLSELFEAANACEPTNYDADGDPVSDTGWVAEEEIDVVLTTVASPVYVKEGSKLRYRGKRCERVVIKRTPKMQAWFELNTPIADKQGNPRMTSLIGEENYAEQWVREYRPVYTADGTKVGIQVANVYDKVPYSVDLDLANAAIKRRENSEASRQSKPELKLVTPSVPKQEAANDPPPWGEEDATSPPIAAAHVDAYEVELLQAQHRGVIKQNVHVALKLQSRSYERVTPDMLARNAMQLDEMLTRLANQTHQPAEDNLQEPEVQPSLYMDGSAHAEESEALPALSSEEQWVMDQIAYEFNRLSLWEKGEVKVQAENEGCGIHHILMTKHEYTKGYHECAIRNNLAAMDLEAERYQTWLYWAHLSESGDPNRDELDEHRYHEYWAKRYEAFPSQYWKAVYLSKHNQYVEPEVLQQHLQYMEMIFPSCPLPRSRYRPANLYTTIKSIVKPAPEGKGIARGYGLDTSFLPSGGVRQPLKPVAKSVEPEVRLIHTNLNVPSYTKADESKATRSILEVDKADPRFIEFCATARRPVVSFSAIKGIMSNFHLSDGGILVPT